MGEIMFIALASDTASGAELKTTADWVVRKRLLAVPGVAEVLTIGGDEKQYQVTLNPERLAAYGIPAGDVIEALRASNANTTAGREAMAADMRVPTASPSQCPFAAGKPAITLRCR